MTQNSKKIGIISIALVCGSLIAAVFFVLGKSQSGKGIFDDSPKHEARNTKESDILNNNQNGSKAQPDRTRGLSGKSSIDDYNQGGGVVMLTTANGSLTSSAIKDLGLSRDEVPILQEIISSRVKEIETHLASKAIYLESESDADANVFSYQIPALGDERKSILDSLKSDILAKFNEARGGAIFSAFINDPGNKDKLADLGRYDTKIKFHPNEVGDSRIVTFSYTDPITGKRISTSSTTIESFKETFGDTFVFDHNDSK